MTAHEEVKESSTAAKEQEQTAAAATPKAAELPAGVLVYEAPEFFPESCPVWLRTVVEDVWSFTLIHYNIWAVPVVVLFYFMYQWGYGLVVVALVALYLPSFFDGSHKTGAGRVWDSFRQSRIWNVSANFLGVKVIREAELDSTKKYIFGFHPHGIIVLSRIATYGGNWEKYFPGIVTRALGASTMFFVPLGRELCLWLGGVDASRSTADKVFKAGNSIVVYPGGVPEIFMCDPNTKQNELVLQKRLGFVKLAIRHGAELVPTFVFGEKFLYNVWNPPKSVIAFFRKTLKIPVIFFWGKFMWMPKRMPAGKRFGVVYGAPIATQQTDAPSEEQIRAIHAQYVAEIERLFRQYKGVFGYDDDETLVIH